MRELILAWLAASLSFCAAAAQDARPSRDPASVALPAETLLKLKLGSDVIDDYGVAFERLSSNGAIFIIGPNTTREISAAADRARVFLLYQQKDLDGDGRVSRAEYDEHADVTWGTDLDPAGRDILEREWMQADRDADGVVAFDELLALALSLYPVPPDRAPTAIEAAILTMDLDGDGFVYWEDVERVLTAPR